MNNDLERVLRGAGGVCHRGTILQRVPDHILEHAVAAGQVRRLFPKVYCLPSITGDPVARMRGALAYAGPGAAISHLSALAVWGLASHAGNALIELTTPSSRRLRSAAGLIIHRSIGPQAKLRGVVSRGGLSVVGLERAIVESWPHLNGDEQRAPAITAVRDRRTTVDRLVAELPSVPGLRGLANLRRLLALIGSGCHSELELWGYDRIFSHSDLPPSDAQVKINLDGRVVYLDRLYREEQVNVELDGAKWHRSAADRERDLRRDSLLMARGLLVVRFTHARLMAEPDDVRNELKTILYRQRRRGVA
jgi:uncharacterized protein DUF559